MLYIVKGKSGYGKTEYIWSKINDDIAQGKKVIVLVPEQFSFVNEKRLCELRCEKKSLIDIEILSFTRLSNIIFREYGGVTKKIVTNNKSVIIMARILDKLRGFLKIYNKHIKYKSFCESIINMVEIIKNSCVTLEEMNDFIGKIEQGLLFDKLKDISLIYKNYQSVINNKYLSTADVINYACEKLELNDNFRFFNGCNVYIDGFKAFTKSEYKMLKYIMLASNKVYLTLCLDDKCYSNNMGISSYVKETEDKIKCILDKNSNIFKSIILTKPLRFQNKDLIQLESMLYNDFNFNEKKHYKLNNKDNINIIEAENPYQEVKYIASQICSLVKDKNYRFKDFNIIVRDLEIYRLIIENIFKTYEIPYFLDEKRQIIYNPLIIFIMASLEAIKGNFNTVEILKLLKTGFVDVDEEIIFELELYCNIWNIKGDMWINDFVFNPRGFSDKFDENEKDLLYRINEARKKIMEPLLNLKNSLSVKISSKKFVNEFYKYLIYFEIPDKLSRIDDNKLKDDNDRLWNVVIDILDDICEIVDEELRLVKFVELIDMAFSNFDMGLLPQTLDQVIVGRADRIITYNPKIIFVAGMNQGVFPSTASFNGVFAENECKRLDNIGLELSKSKLKRLIEERYYVYIALTAASQRVYISYFNNSIDGKFMCKSPIIRHIENEFIGMETIKIDKQDIDVIHNLKTAYSYLCRNFNIDNEELVSVKRYLQSNTYYMDKVKKLDDIIQNKKFVIENVGIIKKYLGNRLYLSPSSIERFNICKFKFFCSDILRVRDYRRAELNSMEFGIVVHYALKFILEEYTIDGKIAIDIEKIPMIIDKFLNKYINDFMGEIGIRTNKIQYIFSKIKEILNEVVVSIISERLVSKFNPVKFEMNIDNDEDVRPLVLKTITGEEIYISGKIDRIDIYENGDKKYFRIIDYKTGYKSFKLDDVFYGLNMQMLIYLFIISACGRNKFKNLHPAGILYMPIKSKFILNENRYSNNNILFQDINKFKMNGLVINDMELLNAMEEGIGGNYIPVKIKKDGGISKTSSVIDREKFLNLRNYIRKLVFNMVSDIYNGEIEAVPVCINQYNMCKYCEYKIVCKIDENGEVQDLKAPPEDWLYKAKE